MEALNFERFSLLEKLGDSLRMAEIRCLSSEVILSMIPSLWNAPEQELIYRRILEINFSNQDIKKIVAMLTELDKKADQAKGKVKRTIDRSIMKISDVLNGTEARSYFINELKHSRKHRRNKAYKALRRIGIGSELSKILFDQFQNNRDQEALELIARDKEAIQAVNIDILLDNIESEYWRMRVVESIIEQPVSEKMLLGVLKRYPWELIYAVGRTKQIKYLKHVKKVVNQHKSDLKILGIAAWTYGQLQARSELTKIRELYESERSNGA